MENKISLFISEQKNMTFCTSAGNEPYCASCFYAFLEEYNTLVFKSSPDSKHILDAIANNRVAGTIVPDIHQPGTIRGVQFTGNFFIPGDDISDQAKRKYYSRFPFALIMQGELWAIELTEIKMTDNTLGFGKKIKWNKSDRETPALFTSLNGREN